MKKIAAMLAGLALLAPAPARGAAVDRADDLLFIHHSSGGHWLLNSLREALKAKDYIDEFNEIGYTTDISPDAGRPDSLTLPGDNLVPGDHTDMNHWVRWFNDYVGRVKTHDSASGVNRIIMFKSCYPTNNVGSEVPGGDPFADKMNLSNYKAVFRHPEGPGKQYSYNGAAYKPLEDIFAENPDTLFIYVTAPPLLPRSTNPENAARARAFDLWVKTAWLDSYNAAHAGLSNVAVFDWFDVLAVPGGTPDANTLRPEYATSPTDNHPNDAANSLSTRIFATDPGNFLDTAWHRFTNAPSIPPPPIPPPPPPLPMATGNVTAYPVPYRPGSGGPYDDPPLGKGIVFTGLSERSRIRIYTVSGELVRDVEVTGAGGRYLWDAADAGGAAVASGVYPYVITIPGSENIRGKLAVIR